MDERERNKPTQDHVLIQRIGLGPFHTTWEGSPCREVSKTVSIAVISNVELNNRTGVKFPVIVLLAVISSNIRFLHVRISTVHSLAKSLMYSYV